MNYFYMESERCDLTEGVTLQATFHIGDRDFFDANGTADDFATDRIETPSGIFPGICV